MVRATIGLVLGIAFVVAMAADHRADPVGAATINVACDTNALIQAIETANNETTNPGLDSLELTSGCTYTLTAAYFGGQGLPPISTRVTINGHGSVISRDPAAATRFRILNIGSGGIVTLNETTITGGRARNGPGAGQAGDGGGGILVSAGSSLTVVDSTVTGNQAGNGMDNGLSGGDGGTGGPGGGIMSAGNLTVVDSTVSFNSAGNGGNGRPSEPSGDGGTGGSGGGISAGGSTTVVNSTISGNDAGNGGQGGLSAGDGGDGGGLALSGTGTRTLTNTTVTDNDAGRATVLNFGGIDGVGGGVHNAAGVSTVSKNTLVANNGVGDECGGVAFAVGSTTNMMSVGNCGASFTQKTSGEINLGPLAGNGGPTSTHALLYPSAAIDAGDNATCAAAPVNNLDQRGESRPVDGNGDATAVCDIGAYEAPALQPDPDFVVNTTAEEDDGACHLPPGDCSIREAINAANANSSPSIIKLGSGETYTFTTTVTPGNALPVITAPLTIDGNGSTLVRDFPAPRMRLIDYCCSGSLTLSEIIIRGGRAPIPFAGPGEDGGGIRVTGALALDNSTVVGNEAGTGSETSIFGAPAGNGGNGGGIWVSGTATITNSAIRSNVAGHGATGNDDPFSLVPGGDGGNGGGVFVDSGTLNVANSTIEGNYAGTGGYPGGDGGSGGGFYVPAAGSGDLTNVTMSNNSAGGGQIGASGVPNGAPGSGGGVYLTAGSNIAAKNSIITTPNIGGNCSGSFAAASATNMSSDASCDGSFTVKSWQEINLAPPQDNGGPTFTMALQPGSDAIDAGDNSVCAAAPVNNLDQRAVTRPIDGDYAGGATCDIGAYEAPPAQSGPQFTVNSTGPDNDGQCQLAPDDCTLREAINAAKLYGLPGTVVLGNAQTYTLDVVDNGFNGLPLITTNITIQGNGSTIARNVAAPPQFRIFEVSGSGILTIQDATVSGGYAPDADTVGGGGILVAGAAHLIGSTVSSNSAGNGTSSAQNGKPGGGISAMSATLTLTDSTVSGNTAGNGFAGGLGFGGRGGGVYFGGTGTLTVNRSTVAGNAAGDGGSAGGEGGWGGGLFIEPGADRTISNSTIANNSAGDSVAPFPRGTGGGIANFSAGLVLTNVTLSGNAVGAGGGPGMGGGNIETSAAILAKNTIISGPAVGANCQGAPFNGASATNLASDATCSPGFTQQTTSQINLGPLADNGGPTQTMALQSPSAAMDAGDNAACTFPPVANLDQRGVTRPFDGDGNGIATCDIGVFEYCPDADVDLVCSPSDNCPDWPNPSQTLPAWALTLNDSDCDGFTTARETYLTTNPTKHCAATSAQNDEAPPDFWPLDMNDNRFINTIDVAFFIGKLGLDNTEPGWTPRLDLNQSANGIITTVDVAMYIGRLGLGCSPVGS